MYIELIFIKKHHLLGRANDKSLNRMNIMTIRNPYFAYIFDLYRRYIEQEVV